MNGFVKFAACSLVLAAGCQSADRLSSWTTREEAANAVATQELSSKIEKSSPGLNSVQAAAGSDATQENRIRRGQAEVAAWYQDHRQEHLTIAKGHFQSVLEESPQSSRAQHGLAIICDLEQNFEEAERHYQQALIQNPNNSDILGDMGYSYLLQNRLSESEQYSLRAIQAQANNKKAIKHLADAYARQGKTELAEKTYRKVLAADDVQRALAENAPPQSPADAPPEANAAANPSLVDRLIPGKSKGERIVAEIQEKQQAYAEKVRQQQQQSRPAVAANRNPESGRMSQGDILKQRLQLIDEEGPHGNAGGPIFLDDQTGQITRLPGAESAPSRGGRNPAATEFSPSYLPAQSPASRGPANGNVSMQQSPLPQQGMGNSGFADNSAGSGQAFSQPSGHYFQGGPGSGPMTVADAPTPQQQFRQDPGVTLSLNANAPANPRRVQQPWSGVQQASANMAAGPEGSSSQSPAGQASYVQPAGGASMAGQSGWPQQNAMTHQQAAAPQMASPAPSQVAMQQFTRADAYPMQSQGNMNGGNMGNTMNPQAGDPALNGSGAGQPGDAYQQASVAAARMGMGLAPSDSIRAFQQQQAAINHPGSMSYDNEPPQRYMPDRAPIPDLNQAYQPYANLVRPPAGPQGLQMPPAVVPSYTREQFGTASRYDTATLENSDVPPSYNQAMKGYEAERWEAGRYYNRSVPQVWEQGPMNSPFSPTAGSIYSHPNASGDQSFSPTGEALPTGYVQPSQWQYSQDNPLDAGAQAQSQQQQAEYPQSSGNPPGGNQGYPDTQSYDNSGITGYANQQYLTGRPNSTQYDPSAGNPANAPNANYPQRNGHLVIPSAYDQTNRSGAQSGNRVAPAGAIAEPQWPSIRPASR